MTWAIDGEDVRKLESHFRTSVQQPAIGDRIRFLSEEQKNILEQVSRLEEAKSSRQRLAVALVATYLGFLVAPYKLASSMSSASAFFYALAGIWLSVGILVQNSRALLFMGEALRQKAVLFAALNSNRAYVFANDPHYYNRTVWPMGRFYDDSRAWTTERRGGKDRSEVFPKRIRASLYPVWFVLLTQILFIAGLIHFIAVLMRAAAGDRFQRIGVWPENGLEMFSRDVFVAALLFFAPLAMLWLQFFGNTCLGYHRAQWEAKRICSERPNPRATGAAARGTATYRWLGWGMQAMAVVAVVNAVVVVAFATGRGVSVTELAQSLTAGQLTTSVWLAGGSVAAFLGLKIVSVLVSLMEETRDDEHRVPLRKLRPNIERLAQREGGVK